MATSPGSLPAAKTHVYTGKNAARDVHVSKAETAKAFDNLVDALSEAGVLYTTWKAANEHYTSVCALTAIPGSVAGVKTREEALHAARMAQLAYKAPMDIATTSARGAGVPGLLSDEEWVELAFHKTPSLQTLGQVSQEDYKNAVDKAVADLKESYKEYKDVISEDQYKRGIDAAKQHRTRYFDWLNGKPLTAGEQAIADINPKKDAVAVVDAEVKAQAKLNVDKDPAYIALSSVEQQKQAATFIDNEVKKIKSAPADPNDPNSLTYAERIEKKEQEITAKKNEMTDELKYAKQAYTAGIENMTFTMDATFSALNAHQEDREAHNKDNPTAKQMDVSKKDEITALVKTVTTEEEKSVVANYHAHARRYEEQFVKAGKMGRYDAELRASREAMSDKKSAELEKIGENATRKKNGDAMLINGIPCEHAGSIEMFGLRTGSTWFGWQIGGGSACVKDVGKFMEAWLVETAAANNSAYQKLQVGDKKAPEPLSVVEMLKAYSNEEFQKNEKGEVIKNENMQNGSPLNAFRLSSIPVQGGVNSTMRALANFKAIGDILGIEVAIDIDAIVSNAAAEDQPMAKRVRHEFSKRLGPNDDVYLKPAKADVIKEYGLTGTPAEQRQQLIRKLTGNATAAPDHGIKITGTDPAQAGISGKASSTTGVGSPATAAATPSTATPTVGSGNSAATSPPLAANAATLTVPTTVKPT